MCDLAFNELSVDFAYSNMPSSEQEAMDILRDFVKVCLAYRLAVGKPVFVREYGGVGRYTSLLSSTPLWAGKNIFALLTELQKQGAFSDDEVTAFRQMLAELSLVAFDPEYTYCDKEVFGMGRGVSEQAYVVSLRTHEDWGDKEISGIQVLTVLAICPTATPTARHISGLPHIFIDHGIWESCAYVLSRPKSDNLYPNFERSVFVPQAFGHADWAACYTSLMHRRDITQVIQLGKIVARVNGYEHLGIKSGRHTFKAKKFYLQIDTQHIAFEVYSGPNTHIGEMLFSSDKLNAGKEDGGRKIVL